MVSKLLEEDIHISICEHFILLIGRKFYNLQFDSMSGTVVFHYTRNCMIYIIVKCVQHILIIASLLFTLIRPLDAVFDGL